MCLISTSYLLFQISKGLSVHILTFIPAILLGIIGGGLGAFFNFVNLKLARLRRRTLANISAKWKQNTIRMAEPIIIMVSFVLISLHSQRKICNPSTFKLYGRMMGIDFHNFLLVLYNMWRRRIVVVDYIDWQVPTEHLIHIRDAIFPFF